MVEYTKQGADIVLKDGHTMFISDVLRDLNRKAFLEEHAMTLHEIVHKMVGPINPVGDASVDCKRLENMKVFIQLTDALLTDIDAVVTDNHDRQEASMKRAADLGAKFYKDIGIKE